MQTTTPSALRPLPFRPTWEVGASLGIHVLLAATLVATEYMSRPDEPLIDMSQVMMVQAVALPKQTTRLPDKPMRTPDPPKAAPAPEPTPAVPVPPTASDMVLHKDDAPKAATVDQPQDRTDDRQKLLNEMKRKQLVDQSAPLGPEDKVQTSPDGVDPSEAVFGSGIGMPMDREASAWWSKARPLIWANWSPLPGTVAAHPEYNARVKVKVEADGTLSGAELYKGTGDSSFDRSAVMAVIKTGKVPPPPARFAESWAKAGTIFEFPASER